MKTVASIALQPDMILAEDVYGPAKERIAKAGDKITPQLIGRLKQFNIICVNIKDAVDLADTYFAKIQASDEFKKFTMVYRAAFNGYKMALQKLLDDNIPVDINSLLYSFNSIMNCVSSPQQLISFLYNKVPSEDDLTYAHCLNSALLAGLFAKWVGMKEEEIQLVILCGYFYDIGKLMIPDEIIWKPGKLTDLEMMQMRTHTFKAFNILQGQALPPEVIKCALTHHERSDGKGYPSGLKGNQISKYTKLITIVDSYEAMTSARTYRDPMHPFQIIGIMENEKFSKYDAELIHPILMKLSNMQIGSKLLLSDGRKGSVIFINPAALARPVLRDDNGQQINLALEPNVSIKGFA